MDEKQESKKTVVSFIAGLLVGALLVWVFTAGDDTTKKDADADHDSESEMMDSHEDGEMDDEKSVFGEEKTPAEQVSEALAELATGEGSVTVANQPAGSTVTLTSIVAPIDEGWVAVRDYQNDRLGNILGAARFSKEQGLVPDEVIIQRVGGTVAGNTYAVVFYTENGDREFSLATDAQVDGPISTFVAQ